MSASPITELQRRFDSLAEQEEKLQDVILSRPDCPKIIHDRYRTVCDLRSNTEYVLSCVHMVNPYGLPSVASVVMTLALWVAANNADARAEMWKKVGTALDNMNKEAAAMGQARIDKEKAAAAVDEARVRRLDAKVALLTAEGTAKQMEAKARAEAEARRAKYDTMSWFGRVFFGVEDEVQGSGSV
jgi:hypothetical protein